MWQCHIINSCTFSPLVLLYLVKFLRFVSPPGQFRIKIQNFAFLIRFSVICFFYDTRNIWLHTHKPDVSDVIEKLPRPSLPRSLVFSKYFDMPCMYILFFVLAYTRLYKIWSLNRSSRT